MFINIAVILLAIYCIYLHNKIYELEFIFSEIVSDKIKKMAIQVLDNDDKSEDE